MDASSVNFGNIAVQDGKVTLSPIIKGIDFKQIVDSLIDVKKVEITKQKNELEKSVAYTQALTQLQQNLQNIQTAAQPLQNSSDSSLDSVFNAVVVSLQSTNSGVNAEAILSVTPKIGVQQGNYSLTITNLASADVVTAGGAVSDPTLSQTGLTAGDLILNGVNISVQTQASLNQVISAINAQTNQTNVLASAIKVSSTEYYLTLNATTTGTPIVVSDDQSGNLLNALNIAASGATVDSLSAHLIYNNLSINRPSNQITDLIPALTLNLFTPSPSPIIVIIKPDISAITTALQNFVNVYNEYQTFYIQQTLTDPVDGKTDPKAILYNDSLLRLTSTYLSGRINAQAVGIPYSQPSSLSALGIHFTEQGYLALNQKVLNTYVSNPSTIEQVCGFDWQSNNDQISFLNAPPFLSSSFMDSTTHTSLPVTVNYTKNSGGIESVAFSMNGVTEVGTIANNCISPVANSIFRGFEFFFDQSSSSNGTSVSTDFTFSQGSMDHITNTIASYLEPNGVFDTTLETLAKDQRFLYNKMKATEVKIAEERTRLTKTYAKVAEAYEKMEANIRTIRDFNNSFYTRN